jgi:hypothetical protein
VSRAAALAKRLRDLKLEHVEISERKSVYDYDANRAVAALARFDKIVKKESSPDARRGVEPTADSTPPPSMPIPDDSPEQESNDVKPSWAKKAYRQIALKTHPDKITNSLELSDSQKDRLLDLYREATVAYQSGNYESLAEVAAELDVEVEIPAEMLEKALESKLSSIRQEMLAMTKTISWAWGISFGDVPKRVIILKSCCLVMGISKPDDKTLEDIVKELESNPDFDVVDRLGNVKRIKSGAERRKVGTRPEKRIR